MFSSPTEALSQSRLRYLLHHRRCKRGYSHSDCDLESDDFGKSRPGAFEYRWGRCRIPTVAYNCTKRRRSLSKGDDEEVFWLAGPKSDTISEGFGSCYRRGRDWCCWPFVNCSITTSQPMKQSHSEARKGFKSLDFPIIPDSSNNPFYTAPLLHVSSQTPGNTHYEKPTVTYVLWVVYLPQLWGTSQYQDLLYNHKENLPLSPPPPSDVPSSFPTHRKENIKEGPLVDAGKVWDGARVVIGDSDDDNESQRRSEGAEREKCWLCPSSTLGCGRKQRQRHWLARVILYEAFSPDLLRPWPGFWRPTLAHLFWRSYIVMTITLCQSLCSQTGHCETTYSFHLLFDLVSSILLCCFWSINNVVFLRSICIKVWFVATMRYLFLQSSLAWTRRLVGFSLE